MTTTDACLWIKQIMVRQEIRTNEKELLVMHWEAKEKKEKKKEWYLPFRVNNYAETLGKQWTKPCVHKQHDKIKHERARQQREGGGSFPGVNRGKSYMKEQNKNGWLLVCWFDYHIHLQHSTMRYVTPLRTTPLTSLPETGGSHLKTSTQTQLRQDLANWNMAWNERPRTLVCALLTFTNKSEMWRGDKKGGFCYCVLIRIWYTFYIRLHHGIT